MASALQDLKDVLAKFAVHADVIAKITDEQPGGMGMASLADFGVYFTAAEYEDGVQTEILDGTYQASVDCSARAFVWPGRRRKKSSLPQPRLQQ